MRPTSSSAVVALAGLARTRPVTLSTMPCRLAPAPVPERWLGEVETQPETREGRVGPKLASYRTRIVPRLAEPYEKRTTILPFPGAKRRYSSLSEEKLHFTPEEA